MAAASVVPSSTRHCYDFWDRTFRRAGVFDYTEGYYNGDPTLDYERAQQAQLDYLLDAVDCQAGSRLLDIGCGNGRLLDSIARRGARGTGITISPEQVACCTQRGLDVRLLDYRDIPASWNDQFDAVVANGPIEHFVQPEDVAADRADAIYHAFFATCHRLIDPQSPSRRLINTTIHFDRVDVDPSAMRRSPWSFRWFSDEFHCAMLVRGFGGFYPRLGQFERCARPYFQLLAERDATYDYYLTSEEWLRHGKRSFLSPRMWARLFPLVVRRPRYTANMLFLLLASQTWNWQFRTAAPPMKHLWQTWEYQPMNESSGAQCAA